MSYSRNLVLGEIAYDGYHAIDDTYDKFETLPAPVQERWAQGGRSVANAWGKTGAAGLNAERMRTETRAAHEEQRAQHRAKAAEENTYRCWAEDFFDEAEGSDVTSCDEGFAACRYATGLYEDPSFCTVSDDLIICVRSVTREVFRIKVHCVLHATRLVD